MFSGYRSHISTNYHKHSDGVRDLSTVFALADRARFGKCLLQLRYMCIRLGMKY